MSTTSSDYQFVACPNKACRLRFPGVDSVDCPLCKTRTELAAERYPSRKNRGTTNTLPLALLLDNVRSVFNVGSIFRSADGCGVSTIYLGGISPTPDHSAIKKTALGAEQTIKWQHENNGVVLGHQLLQEGKHLWALEGTEHSADIFEAACARPEQELVLILGNEVTGIDPGLLELCEKVVHIPMRGTKASLNVATAAGIAAYALCPS